MIYPINDHTELKTNRDDSIMITQKQTNFETGREHVAALVFTGKEFMAVLERIASEVKARDSIAQ